MKYSLLLFISTIFFACNKIEVKEVAPKNNNLVLAEDIQTILPLEKDTSWAWGSSDFTNISANFDPEKIFSSITKSILSGKIKAYSDYPNKELTPNEVGKILVSWDSTAQVENPNNPGEFVSAPLKTEITAWDVPQIRFHETMELDTVTNILHKRVSHLTLYAFKASEKGEIIGLRKLFDVKFNE